MSRFKITELSMTGLKLVERQRLSDMRGFFTRLFCAEDLAEAGWETQIAQINHSYSHGRGTVRGMHFQYPPYAERKLVNCVRGKVWDVAVDLRVDSVTFLRWHAEELSAENGKALLIPEGFAHGFQALTDDVELLYCTSEAYHPEAEAGLDPRDPELAISWPLEITVLSTKDANHPQIDENFEGVRINVS
jgi:dTDP-4-dehydrorhamnose 3,5-epimerase